MVSKLLLLAMFTCMFLVSGCIGHKTSIETTYIDKHVHDKRVIYLFGGVGKVVHVENDHCTIENKWGKRIVVANDDEKPAIGDYYTVYANPLQKQIELNSRCSQPFSW